MSADSLNPTRIAIAEPSRKKLAQVLNHHLADLLDLAGQLKNAHWNVRGPHFYSLHKAFEEIAGMIDEEVDDLAERITTLGGTAQGSTREVARNTRLPDYPAKVQGLDLVAALAEAVSLSANALREDIETAEAAGDPGTADLLTGLSQVLDKALWLLEAHTPSA
jgi:starvation-inducible DNA-binding protein